MALYKLNKTVLLFSPHAKDFLSGLTSNTLEAPRNAFLDIHGKIIATCDQIALDPNCHRVILETSHKEKLLSHLEQYLLLSDTKIVDEPWNVYFETEQDYQKHSGDSMIPQRAGWLILSHNDLLAQAPDDSFTLFRIHNNIPCLGVDYDHEMLLNVDTSEFISFTKGCFLGQEIVARVHNKSKAPKKLVPITKHDGNDENPDHSSPMTSCVKDPHTQCLQGFRFVPT